MAIKGGLMPYLELQGMQLFYECQGSGNPPLVFVHGYACDHNDWQSQMDFFHTQQHAIACDLRGHGDSSLDAESCCNIETFGADIIALLTALDQPPAILIGHSMGCRVALQAYLEAPQRIAGLVFVDGSRIGTGDPDVAEQKARQMIQSLGYAAMVRLLFDDMFLEGSNPALKERIFSRAMTLPEKIGANLLPRLFEWDARCMDSALSRIEVPLLILQSTYINTDRVRISLHPGARTPWLDLIRQYVPTAQVEIIGGVGHFLMIEAPEAVNQAIAAFIAKSSL